MPELPEVETVCRGAARHLPGRTVRRVQLRRPDLRWPIPVAAVRDLQGRRCTGVGRRSKYLLLRFGGVRRPVALVHLGMSGRLSVDVVRGAEPRPPWREHEHWRLDFGTRLLRFVDPRRFGMLDVVDGRDLDGHRLLRFLGPEPMDAGFDGELLFRVTRGRKASVKSVLMDARRVVGVGNIYASEACHRAGVRPRRAAGRLTRRQCDVLARAVREVLSDAIAAGGTTLRDYVGVDEASGWFQRRLRVYGRQGMPCERCGAGIRRTVDGARSTYWCPGCQK